MSASLSDLASRLDEVRLLAALDPSRAGDTTQPRRTNAINRACILFLSAHLEGYLEDLVVETLDLLVSRGPSVDKLPLTLRSLHVEHHLKTIEEQKDRNKRALKIQTMFSDETALWIPGNTVQKGMLRPRMVCTEMSNPGSHEIRKFLRLIGVDIDKHLAATSKDTLSQMDGLVGRRNSIAHGEVTSGSLTHGDIDNYLNTVNELCREIDSAASHAIQTICAMPTLPW